MSGKLTADGALAILAFLGLIVGLIVALVAWNWIYAAIGLGWLFALAAIAAFLDRKEIK